MTTRLARWRARMQVSEAAWRGAGIALLLAGCLVVAALALAMLVSAPGLEPAYGIGVIVALLVGIALVSWIVVALVRRLPWPTVRGALALAVALGVPSFAMISGTALALLIAGGLLAVGVLGGCIAALRERGWQWVPGFGAVMSAGVLGTALALYLMEGWSVPERQWPMRAAAPLAAPDPGTPGSYRVQVLTYGSGADRHRLEYGADVDLEAPSVDASAFIDGWDGAAGWGRTKYWGFDVTALPLQGRVWYPDDDVAADEAGANEATPAQRGAPFPIVLIVHGNHDMEDYSDAGYAYLGELFASRGIVAVSVDENFLNGSVADMLGGPDGGLEEENDARGWLLLEHLKLWRAWNDDPSHRFYDRIDLDRVVLIGHSRGGEAVAEAALFNGLARYPDDATLPFDFGFGIRGIIAIAPSDGQYDPRDRDTRLAGVSYLVVHGSLDGDVQSFSGLAQYARTRTACAGCFKSAVYVVGANHGQFNTTWGREDFGVPWNRILNLGPIIPGDTQRQIARVFFSAFLEAVLRDDDRYRDFFADPERGRAWLAGTPILTKFSGARDRVLAAFEEDADPATATMRAARIETRGLSVWHEREVPLKWNDQDSAAVTVGWDNRSAASAESRYTITFAEPLAVPEAHSLAFSIAMSEVSPVKTPSEDGDADGWEVPETIDLHVEIVDGHGARARVALADVAALQQPVKSITRKAELIDPLDPGETIFQRYVFPLSAWRADNPLLDTTHVAAVSFVFDVTPAGVIVLDDVVVAPR